METKIELPRLADTNCLEVLEPSDDRTPIAELLEESDDEKIDRISVDDLQR